MTLSKLSVIWESRELSIKRLELVTLGSKSRSIHDDVTKD